MNPQEDKSFQLLPRKAAKEYTLVLDLDETLAHYYKVSVGVSVEWKRREGADEAWRARVLAADG